MPRLWIFCIGLAVVLIACAPPPTPAMPTAESAQAVATATATPAPSPTPYVGQVAFNGLTSSNAVHLYVATGLGENITRITESGLVLAPRWSPNGEWLAVITVINEAGENPILYAVPVAQPGRSNWVSLTPVGLVSVPSFTDLRYQPVQWLGNDRLVFAGQENGLQAVYRVDIATQTLTQISPPGDHSQPSASPDGDWVVMAGPDGLVQVALAATNAPTQLTTAPVGSQDLFPAVSPNGETIAFLRMGGSAAGVYSMAANGGEPQLLTPSAADDIAFAPPVWSPNAAQLAVTIAPASGADNSLLLFDVASGNVREIKVEGRIAFPVFAPDSSALLFTVLPANGNPYLMRASIVDLIPIRWPPRTSFSTFLADWR